MEIHRGRTRQRYFTLNNRGQRRDRAPSFSGDRYVSFQGQGRKLRGQPQYTNHHTHNNTHPQNYRSYYNNLDDRYQGTHYSSSSAPDTSSKRPMGRFKKRYSRQKKVYRAEDGFTHDAAFYEGEQEFEFQVEPDSLHMQPTPSNRGPKRRFTGRGLHYTAPANRSSHILSFVDQGGTFRNVNMNTRNDKQTQKRDRNTRHFPQKKGEGRPNHTIRKPPRNDFIPAPPKLKRAIQLMYKLLKLTHHMSRVTTKVEGNQPLTFKRLANLLTNTIRPAFPNETVTQMVKGSALNWAYTTQLILEQHYEDQVEVTLQEIKEETEPKDWAQAFEIASGWASKNYGAKIDKDIIERTEALITVELCETEQPAPPRSPPSEPGPSTSNIRSYAQVVASTPSVHHTVPPQITVRPPPNVQNIEIQTSPSLFANANTTHRRDWSFDEEAADDNPLDPMGVLQPILITSPPPKTQRVTRGKKVHIVLPEETSPQHPHSPKQMMTDRVEAPTEENNEPTSNNFLLVEGEVFEGSLPRNEPLTQAVFKRADRSPPLSLVLFSDDEEEAPLKPPSPLTAFLREACDNLSGFSPSQQERREEEPNHEVGPIQAHRADGANEYAEPEPIQAQVEVTVAENTAMRPIQALGEVPPLGDHMVRDSEKDSLNPLGKEPTRGKHSSKQKHLSVPPVVEKSQQASTSAEQPRSVQSTIHGGLLTRPTRHANTSSKLQDWSLILTKKFVIIGDSNIARLPKHNYPELQIDSFPGAKWQHAANLLTGATIVEEPHKIILSFGLNNRQQRFKINALAELQKARAAAAARLPNTEVLIPIINYSPDLPLEEQEMVEHINSHIKRGGGIIPALPYEQFRVENDGIHWRALTARAIFNHWLEYLN